MNRLMTFISSPVAFMKQDGTWRSRVALLAVTNIALIVGFAIWRTLLDNFSVEEVYFTGKEIGILQSLREVPGFLAFTTVLLLLLIREQRLAMIALLAFGVGIALTGAFPTVIGLYCTTVLMSLGFHYFETVNQSLSLQWLPKERAPEILGQILSLRSMASILCLALLATAVFVFEVSYFWIYAVSGGTIVMATLWCWWRFPSFQELVPQNKSLLLRKRYWLYYTLTFLSGARRQIFMVFAGFMLVEKFEYSVLIIILLYLLNEAINAYIAPKIGRYIIKYGERKALIIEYVGLFFVFTSYAFVENATFAGALYVIDHMFFAFAIAQKTYFQKIADPEDMASTASVAFTINHIAAVGLPAILGLIWLSSPTFVFLFGSALALASLSFSCLVPSYPQKGREVIFR
ncbi:MAG: MFS transporter [Alphaproteobacteria bacterium]